MATGENREITWVGGVQYLYNPNTGNWFTLAGEPISNPTLQPGTWQGGYPTQPTEPTPTTSWGGYGPSTPTTTTTAPTVTAPAPEEPEDLSLVDEIQALLSPFFDTTSINDLTQNIIRPAIIEGLNATQIIDRVYQSDTFKTFFPEWQQRIDNGFAAMAPVAILDYRDKAKQIAKQWSGVELSNEDIAKFITSDRSLVEFAATLETWERFQTFGPEVQEALSAELGRPISDDEAFMFISNDFSTPELDNAYRQAAYRGFAKKFNLRPISEEEVGVLNKNNITVEQAMAGYQQLANRLPTYDRLAAIDAGLAGNSEAPHDSVGDLIGDIFGLDPEAQLRLSQMVARENARFGGGGGVAGGGLGLLTPGERQR